MFVGIARFELFLLEQPNSLKGKRSVVRRLVDRIRSRLKLSVAEVGAQDVWQRTVIGVTTVSSDQTTASNLLETAAKLIVGDGSVEVLNDDREVFSF